MSDKLRNLLLAAGLILGGLSTTGIYAAPASTPQRENAEATCQDEAVVYQDLNQGTDSTDPGTGNFACNGSCPRSCHQ